MPHLRVDACHHRRVAPSKTAETGDPRRVRRDAVANRERVLDAAAVAIKREGQKVPLATIASDAGVGVGTLYRGYPSRDALLVALARRSYNIVLEQARSAESSAPAIASIAIFLERVIDRRADLVALPLHGGPAPNDPTIAALQGEIRLAVERMLHRGRKDGTVRRGVVARDVIIMGALLAQPLPRVVDWDRTARRQLRIYLDGLALTTAPALPRRGRLAGAEYVGLEPGEH